MALLVIAVALSSGGMFFLVRHFMRRTWAPLIRAFPPQPIAPGAVRKVAQSFRYGQLSADGAMALTADQAHLHIEGWGPFKWVGQTRVSVPWEKISVSVSPLGKAAAIDGHPVTLPGWCLEIAAATAERTPSGI